MADMFTKSDAERILQNKHILYIGDSNIRSMYKDLVWLLQNNSITPENLIKRKLENSFANDTKIAGRLITAGVGYVEDRSYQHDMGNDSILIEFSFITRCFTKNLKEIFNDIASGKISPDLIVMNSTLWDLTRWGPDCIDRFKENMIHLMNLVSNVLPPTCLFLWLTALPVSPIVTSSLLDRSLEFVGNSLRFNVLEANNYTRQIVGMYGYDVLDLHYYARLQFEHQTKDGVHFRPQLMRFFTNLILTHCCLSWNLPLPGNVVNQALDSATKLAFKEENLTNYIDVDSLLSNIEKMAPNKELKAPGEKLILKSNNVMKPSQTHNMNKPPPPSRSGKSRSKNKRWYPARPGPYPRYNSQFRGYY